jgi:Zn-dependent peptidase ImmA (M78 family)
LGFRRGFQSEAERISCEVREKVGLSPTDSIDLTAVCSEFEINILPMTELPCDSSLFQATQNGKFSAMMAHIGLQSAIIHNDTHHEHRQRSNICHELAHCFLGHEACTLMDEDGSRSHNGEIEAEANFLGGALLLPKAAAIHILKNGLKSQARAIYGVSNPMLTYRLRVSGAQIIFDRSMAKKIAA